MLTSTHTFFITANQQNAIPFKERMPQGHKYFLVYTYMEAGDISEILFIPPSFRFNDFMRVLFQEMSFRNGEKCYPDWILFTLSCWRRYLKWKSSDRNHVLQWPLIFGGDLNVHPHIKIYSLFTFHLLPLTPPLLWLFNSNPVQTLPESVSNYIMKQMSMDPADVVPLLLRFSLLQQFRAAPLGGVEGRRKTTAPSLGLSWWFQK